MASYTAPPVHVARFRGARRADLVFSGVDLAGPSFEARVFLNNPRAHEGTPKNPEHGYAGSFHVYGYGNPAPPAVAAASANAEGGGPIVPIEKRLHVDEAALRTALETAEELTITVVPAAVDPSAAGPERPFERVDVVFDPSATEP